MNLPKLVKFINYQKEKTSPEMEKILGNLERKYNLTREHALQYFDLMRRSEEGQEQLSKIMTMYDVGLVK